MSKQKQKAHVLFLVGNEVPKQRLIDVSANIHSDTIVGLRKKIHLKSVWHLTLRQQRDNVTFPSHFTSALLGLVIETVSVDMFFELAYVNISTVSMAMSKQNVRQNYDGIHWNVKFVTSLNKNNIR